ncbi:hypothetical protein LH51_09880 [Nitrincola sp. A-D6]|nr:hypothetical protein LH51_09880 [Nitrincola sp. A-D6]
MISVASEMVNQLGDSTVIERVQQVFFNVYTEVATTLFHGNSRIQLTHMETLAGVVERRVRIPTSELNSQIHQHYEKFLTGQSSNLFASSDGQPPNGRNSGLHQHTHRFGSINVTTYDYVTDTAAGRASAGLSGIALALALFSAQKTIKDWHDHHRFDARSKAGAIANLPAVQLSVAFSTVVASYSSLRAEATFIRASQGAAQLATRFAAYAIAGLPGRGYVLPQRPKLGISSTQMALRAQQARILGGIGLVIGLLISAGQAWEGKVREDYA